MGEAEAGGTPVRRETVGLRRCCLLSEEERLLMNCGGSEKSPEYLLYMLNRQTVKNPAIPLVPGEMKLTALDDGMLQVARRGDSKSCNENVQRYG